MLLCNTVWRRPLISEAGVVGEPVLCQCRSHCVGIDTIASLGQEETQIKRTIIGLSGSHAISTRQYKILTGRQVSVALTMPRTRHH